MYTDLHKALESCPFDLVLIEFTDDLIFDTPSGTLLTPAPQPEHIIYRLSRVHSPVAISADRSD